MKSFLFSNENINGMNLPLGTALVHSTNIDLHSVLSLFPLSLPLRSMGYLVGC